jgi:multidrug efflux pump subunit AcrB
VQARDANALDVADKVRATVTDLEKTFPPGASYTIPFDATLFVCASMKELATTLGVAILLVVLVIFAFFAESQDDARSTGYDSRFIYRYVCVDEAPWLLDQHVDALRSDARFVQEKHLSPFHAAVEGVREISGAVVEH